MRLGLSKAKNPDKFDIILIAYIVTMMLTSFVSIYSAFGIVGAADGWGYITKQAMWFMIGFIALAFIMYLGNDSMVSFAKIGYWFLMICLVVLLIGKVYYMLRGSNLPLLWTANGATSWFKFPFFGQFQPSEFIKIVLIIITANIIDEHNKDKVFDSYEQDFSLFMKIGKWAVPPLILILAQPDTGIVIIIFVSLLVMVACSGIKRQWLMIVGLIVVVALILFFYMYFYQFDTLNNLIGGTGGYKLRRITGWLDPMSTYNTDGHQLFLALLALGSAGLTGHGMGLNLVRIPEAQTDFIFAVIGQSWGLIGTIFIVGLCLGLNLHLCKVASLSTNMYEKYIVLGILGMILYQQFQNIGMIIGLLPITGITLPLISYGGSSLLSYFIAFGIIMNISGNAKKVNNYTYK